MSQHVCAVQWKQTCRDFNSQLNITECDLLNFNSKFIESQITWVYWSHFHTHANIHSQSSNLWRNRWIKIGTIASANVESSLHKMIKTTHLNLFNRWNLSSIHKHAQRYIIPYLLEKPEIELDYFYMHQ